MNKIKTPTPEQQSIINSEGNIVVIAAPGSGKTFVVSEKIKRILKTIHDYQGVIAISFTNKASDELKRRVLKGGTNPLSSFFGTIDKFCFMEFVASFGKQVFGYPKCELEVIEKEDLPDLFKEEYKVLTSLSSYADVQDEHIEFYSRLFKEGKILLSSISLLANHVFDNSSACRKYLKAKYTAVIMDEYQDSGYDQHEIFSKLSKLGLTAIAVGDVHQAIYGFAGKDMKYLMSLQEEGFTSFSLLINHRCHPSISNYSKALIQPFLEGIEPVFEETDENRVFLKNVTGDERNICEWIENRLGDLLTTYKIEKLNKIGILVRANWKGEYIDSLLNLNSRFVITTPLDKEVSLWGMVFKRLLTFIFNPSDTIIEVIDELTDIHFSKRFTKGAIKRVQTLKVEFEKHSDWNIISDDTTDIESIISAFIEISEYFYPNRSQQSCIDSLRIVLKNEKLLSSYFPSPDDEVQIMTFHKSKGLEFDAVFHLDLYSYILPGKTKDAAGNWVFKDIQQDFNAHYVAITRAKEVCFLVSSTARTNGKFEPKRGVLSEFLTLDCLKHLENYRVEET